MEGTSLRRFHRKDVRGASCHGRPLGGEAGRHDGRRCVASASLTRQEVAVDVDMDVDDADDDAAIKALPRNFDWRNVNGSSFVFDVVNQGACGSCFAIAAVDMIQTRVAIRTGNSVRRRLSSQDVLSCTKYAQACHGGFPFLAAKYAADFGLSADSCLSYSGSSDVQCPLSKDCFGEYGHALHVFSRTQPDVCGLVRLHWGILWQHQ